jgi:hypothetical protein
MAFILSVCLEKRKLFCYPFEEFKSGAEILLQPKAVSHNAPSFWWTPVKFHQLVGKITQFDRLWRIREGSITSLGLLGGDTKVLCCKAPSLQFDKAPSGGLVQKPLFPEEIFKNELEVNRFLGLTVR